MHQDDCRTWKQVREAGPYIGSAMVDSHAEAMIVAIHKGNPLRSMYHAMMAAHYARNSMWKDASVASMDLHAGEQ